MQFKIDEVYSSMQNANSAHVCFTNNCILAACTRLHDQIKRATWSTQTETSYYA